MTEKQKAWHLCSLFIRLRDALEFCKRMRIDLTQFSSAKDLPVQCCTCPKIKPWREMDAGHYFGRGLGGKSGAYFDERNLNTQCKPCNAFKGGNREVYDKFMLHRYGQEVIDELEILHHASKKYQDGELYAIGQLYKEMYQELKTQI